MLRELINRLTQTSSCHALAHSDYIHHSQVASIVCEELAIECGLSKGWPMTYYKYEPQSMLENSNYKLYYDKSIIKIELSIKIDQT